MPIQEPPSPAQTWDDYEADEWYDGILAKIEDEPDGKFGPSVKFYIDLGETDEDGASAYKWLWATVKKSPNSNFYKYFTGLGWNGTWPIEEQSFVGMAVQVMFEMRERTSKFDGSTYMAPAICSIRAAKGLKAMQKTAARAAQPTLDDDEAPF